MFDRPHPLFLPLTLAFMTTASEPVRRHNGLSYKELISVFNDCFLVSCHCRLQSGYPEPLYLPDKKSVPARICFREDFVSSALHEVAHWCIAGEERRKLVDFGYWYEPDGRSVKQQKKFESVEVKPQALEWLFSLAAGVRFQVSLDNLSGEQSNTEAFKKAVFTEAQAMLAKGLPTRARIFLDALMKKTGCPDAIETMLCYQDL